MFETLFTLIVAALAFAALGFGTLIVPNAGEGKLLEIMVNKTASANCTLFLYSNNATLSNATVLGDLTEVSGGGYAAATLTGATWGVTPGSPSVLLYGAEQVFTFTSVPGTATVYGYGVKVGTTLLWAEALPSAPFTVAAAGDAVKVTPRFTLASVSAD